MSVYKSGAFLQQCFSVHPLSLMLKIATPEMVGVVCTNCRMRHRMTFDQQEVLSSEHSGGDNTGLLLLQQCAHGHPEEVRISSVNVEQQAVEFRCHPCRRTVSLHVALYETHQR